jgi:predicted MFS family arabinose efflux permease
MNPQACVEMPPAFLKDIETSPLAALMRGSQVAVPVIETIHLLAIALAVGTIMAIDLSILGIALRRETVPKISRELAPWTLSGFGVAIVTGVLLFFSESVKMGCKPLFWAKLALLAAAFAFYFTAERKRTPTTAVASLLLWFGVAFGGKAVGLFG